MSRSFTYELDRLDEIVEEAVFRRIGLDVLINIITKKYSQVILEETKGNKAKASRIAGISRQTLYYKEKELCR